MQKLELRYPVMIKRQFAVDLANHKCGLHARLSKTQLIPMRADCGMAALDMVDRHSMREFK